MTNSIEAARNLLIDANWTDAREMTTDLQVLEALKSVFLPEFEAARCGAFCVSDELLIERATAELEEDIKDGRKMIG